MSRPTTPPPEQWRERYLPLETARWRGWIDRALWHPAAEPFIEAPERLFDEHVARWFKRGRNRLAEVRWPAPPDSDGPPPPDTVVLKGFGSRGAIGAIRVRLHPGRARRAWRKAFALLDRGLVTPRPLWLAQPRRGAAAEAFLAVETARGCRRVRKPLKQIRAGRQEVVLDNSYSLDARTFLAELARFVRRMHDAGVQHRDLSGGNILIPHGWRAGQADSAPFILVDINRAHVTASGGRLSLTRRVKDLVRVSVGAEAEEAFHAAYAAGSAELEATLASYRQWAVKYRRMRRARHPLARFWLKLTTHWLRF